MSFTIRTVAGIAALLAVTACSSVGGQPFGSTATVGRDRIVVDDTSGQPINLPASLSQTTYIGEDLDAGVPAQTVLKAEPSFQPTPATHPNASVLYTPQAYSAFRRGNTIFIYVGGSDDPAGRAAVVPGSLWWPSAGKTEALDVGLSSEQLQQQMLAELAAATGGDASANVMFYCDRRDCWAPYNAALRLAGTEYRNVSWYRGGTEAWYVAGLPLEIAENSDWL